VALRFLPSSPYSRRVLTTFGRCDGLGDGSLRRRARRSIRRLTLRRSRGVARRARGSGYSQAGDWRSR